MISKAKTTPLTNSEFDALAAHRADCEALAKQEAVSGGNQFRSNHWKPALEDCLFWFERHVVEELAELRFLLETVPVASVRTLCKVVFSSIIVRVSKQDSDTRYVRRNKGIKPGDAVRLYLNRLNAVSHAINEMSDAIDPD